MKIDAITFGLSGPEGPRALRLELDPAGPTVVCAPAGGPGAAPLAQAVRDSLSSEPRSAAQVPFVRIEAHTPELILELADDGAAQRRTFLSRRPGALPELIQIDAADGGAADAVDGSRELVGRRWAQAAGLADPSHFVALLGQLGDSGARDPDSAAALAYVAARRRAERLATEVRALDDAMTASVVPDWLWIATGAGGLGVFTTVVALLYPEQRLLVVAGLIVASVIGFSLYGWRAYRELGTRDRLLAARAEVRTAREAARAEARALGDAMRAGGETPDAVYLRLEGVAAPVSVPLVLGLASVDADALTRLVATGRQVLVFCDVVSADIRTQPLHPLGSE